MVWVQCYTHRTLQNMVKTAILLLSILFCGNTPKALLCTGGTQLNPSQSSLSSLARQRRVAGEGGGLNFSRLSLNIPTQAAIRHWQISINRRTNQAALHSRTMKS